MNYPVVLASQSQQIVLRIQFARRPTVQTVVDMLCFVGGSRRAALRTARNALARDGSSRRILVAAVNRSVLCYDLMEDLASEIQRVAWSEYTLDRTKSQILRELHRGRNIDETVTVANNILIGECEKVMFFEIMAFCDE